MQVYALTEEEKAALSRHVAGDRVSVLANAVPTREVRSTDRKYDVALVSRLHPRKGIALACDVIRALLDRSPTVHVAIAGPDEGELQPVQALMSAFPGSVRYLGGLYVPRGA